MPEILYSPASPFASKVRMAAAAAGYAADGVLTKTDDLPAGLIAANPLGKIPVLITADGFALHDSRVIIQFLDKETGGRLLPRNAAKRLGALMLESLADGICDCALACVYERRQRPEDKQHQPWVDKQWAKVSRGLDALEAAPPKLPSRLNAGHLALAACLGYLALRFPDWAKGRPKLKRWLGKFRARHAALAAMLPQ